MGSPPPQGSSLRSGLCCPGPSSLNRPHPPHSRAHRDFTARRLIRDAFAVRERLGDPRAVPGFRCPLLPDMPSSMTTGSSYVDKFQSSDVDIGLRRDLSGSALPLIPQSVSRGARISRLPGSHICYGLSVCSPPCTDLTGFPAIEGFYIQASNAIGTSLDMTTASTGLLCWRDLHPLEWQLASLHQIPAGAANAPGSSLGCWRRNGGRAAGVAP